MQKYNNLQKNPLKETKIVQDIIITPLTNLKFQQHKHPKDHLSKISSYNKK